MRKKCLNCQHKDNVKTCPLFDSNHLVSEAVLYNIKIGSGYCLNHVFNIRSKIVNFLRDLRSIEMKALTIKERNLAIKSHRKSYESTIRLLEF